MRLVTRKNAYTWCQLLGWGGTLLLNLFFAWTFRGEIAWNTLSRVMIWVATGLFLTHLMRMLIIRLQVLQKEFEKQVWVFIGITLIFGTLLGSVLFFFVDLFSLLDPQDAQRLNKASRFINYAFSSFLILLVWNLFYFIFHYVEKVRNQQIEALKAESLIRELQLQTIKSHINPHFIFNSLNSIRALIDENPLRARRAINELSNILRSSMQAEKSETVPFEKELNIVKDYLALEQIRFEERLNFRFDIDPNTLTLQVPPMMLQTLVENAIKHGVSQQLEGGEVVVGSHIVNGCHEVVILNSGSLSHYKNDMGFGVSSTRERLQLQFGEKARFELTDQGKGYVNARILMPIDTTSLLQPKVKLHA